MPSPDAFRAWLEMVKTKSYYEILRVSPDADGGVIKGAFYTFSLMYHPDRYVEEDGELRRLATEVFKRGVEAYRTLSRSSSRASYDAWLKEGRSSPKAARRPEPRALASIALSKKAKVCAEKADWLITLGMLEDARLALINACQEEPDNAELAERLTFLYEALALEPSQ